MPQKRAVMVDHADERAMIECVAMGLPIVAVGEARDDAPHGGLFTGGRDDHERCVARLPAWISTWAHGHAVDVDLTARASWLERFA